VEAARDDVRYVCRYQRRHYCRIANNDCALLRDALTLSGLGRWSWRLDGWP
jgi:hypothetical protein